MKYGNIALQTMFEYKYEQMFQQDEMQQILRSFYSLSSPHAALRSWPEKILKNINT